MQVGQDRAFCLWSTQASTIYSYSVSYSKSRLRMAVPRYCCTRMYNSSSAVTRTRMIRIDYKQYTKSKYSVKDSAAAVFLLHHSIFVSSCFFFPFFFRRSPRRRAGACVWPVTHLVSSPPRARALHTQRTSAHDRHYIYIIIQTAYHHHINHSTTTTTTTGLQYYVYYCYWCCCRPYVCTVCMYRAPPFRPHSGCSVPHPPLSLPSQIIRSDVRQMSGRSLGLIIFQLRFILNNCAI